MRVGLLLLRETVRQWWGPLIIAAGAAMLALVKFQVLGGPWIWIALAVVGLGVVRAAWQSTGPLRDSEVTRLPMDGDGPVGGGDGGTD